MKHRKVRVHVKRGLLVGEKFVPGSVATDAAFHVEENLVESYADQVDSRIEVLSLVDKIGVFK